MWHGVCVTNTVLRLLTQLPGGFRGGRARCSTRCDAGPRRPQIERDANVAALWGDVEALLVGRAA